MGWFKKVERAAEGPSFNLRDPALAEFLGLSAGSDAGVAVTEATALGSTAVWRAVNIVAGSVAGLPLKAYRETSGGEREVVGSIFDDPCAPLYTPFLWKQTVMAHLLLHGNAYLLHQYTGAGVLGALFPVHPGLVNVEWDRDNAVRIYKIQTADGVEEYTEGDITHLMGLSLDGLKGVSPIRAARNAIGTGLAGDQAAARMFGSGMLLGGLVSTEEVLTDEEAEALGAGLRARLTGSRNAGDIAVVNASLKFTPWTMNAEDAQFIESRVHQVEEIARIFGVPPHLLGQTEKQTSWGTGVAEQNRGLARYTLQPWTSMIEEKLSGLLASPRWVEFEFKALLRPSPEQEIPLIISEVQAGVLTQDEARELLGRTPLPSVPAPSAEVQQALQLAAAAPSLIQAPGLVALVNQLLALNGKPPLADPSATVSEDPITPPEE
jgi:HK97 family phage portal protein